LEADFTGKHTFADEKEFLADLQKSILRSPILCPKSKFIVKLNPECNLHKTVRYIHFNGNKLVSYDKKRE
jgi:hypothetical protein